MRKEKPMLERVIKRTHNKYKKGDFSKFSPFFFTYNYLYIHHIVYQPNFDK